jgi:hypothetical protein
MKNNCKYNFPKHSGQIHIRVVNFVSSMYCWQLKCSHKWIYIANTIHNSNDAVLLRDSKVFAPEDLYIFPMCTWYVITTMGPLKDNRLHALNINYKTWTHCKCTWHGMLSGCRWLPGCSSNLGVSQGTFLQNVRQDLGLGGDIKPDWRKLHNKEHRDLYFWDY